MQKKIIAVAVAALASTAAFAQTNVTVYGVVDVQQAIVKSSGALDGSNQAPVGRLDTHGNYIGFKGVEDLGNGLKAVFVYETAIATDTNSSTADDTKARSGITGGRDSYIGLAGGFGTVAAGNLTHPLRAFGAKVELLPGAAGFGTMASVTGTIAGIKTGADDRAANAVAYISPAFSGFSVVAAYVNGENRGNDGSAVAGTGTKADPFKGTVNGANHRQYQLAAQYDNGPLFVGVGYHKVKQLALTGTLDGAQYISNFSEDGQDARVYRLAAAYNFPTNTKLTALYDNTKVDLGATGAAVYGLDQVKRNAFSLGVAQSFGKNTIGLEYAQSGKLKVDGASQDQTGVKAYTVVYTYDLSKRTQLHARYAVLNNGDAASTNFYNLSVSNGATVGTGATYTGASVGLRHSF